MKKCPQDAFTSLPSLFQCGDLTREPLVKLRSTKLEKLGRASSELRPAPFSTYVT